MEEPYILISWLLLMILVVVLIARHRRRSRDSTAIIPDPRSKKRIRYKCGHRGFLSYQFEYLGFAFRPNLNVIADRKLCPACIWKEMRPKIIRCAVCGAPILPGPVQLLGSGWNYNEKWVTLGNGRPIVHANLRCGNSPEPDGEWDGEQYRPLMPQPSSGGVIRFAPDNPV
jgi:hypothetical protein